MSMYMYIHASIEEVKPNEPGSVPIINLIYLFTIETRTVAIKRYSNKEQSYTLNMESQSLKNKKNQRNWGTLWKTNNDRRKK